MKVTNHLLAWLNAERSRRGISYQKMSEICGHTVSWCAFRKLLNGLTKSTEGVTDDALCKIFDVSLEDLLAITLNKPLPGKRRASETLLWNWLKEQPDRVEQIRKMGYDGRLPKPPQEAE